MAVFLTLCTVIGILVTCATAAAAEIAKCASANTAPTTITVDNQSSAAITLYWLNDECEEVTYRTLQPGAVVMQQTFDTHRWRVRSNITEWGLREVTAGAAPLTARIADLTNPLARATQDRPDDVLEYQVHVMYVIPSDGQDRELDTNGAIARSVAASQYWFAQQTGGRRLRLDTHEGALDISFVRLNRLEAELLSRRAFIRDEIEKDLKNLGFNDRNKIYAVYYDGDATECGGGPPLNTGGNVGAIYLRGRRRTDNPCHASGLAKSVAQPGLAEYGIVHEILHTLGLVASCAPHQTRKGHVSDSPKDLMYAGKLDWHPQILDVGRDDYFEHGKPGCLDLAQSAFLDPLPSEPVIPTGWSK